MIYRDGKKGARVAARTASSRLCQFSVGIWFRFSSWAHVRKSQAQFKHYRGDDPWTMARQRAGREAGAA